MQPANHIIYGIYFIRYALTNCYIDLISCLINLIYEAAKQATAKEIILTNWGQMSNKLWLKLREVNILPSV